MRPTHFTEWASEYVDQKAYYKAGASELLWILYLEEYPEMSYLRFPPSRMEYFEIERYTSQKRLEMCCTK